MTTSDIDPSRVVWGRVRVWGCRYPMLSSRYMRLYKMARGSIILGAIEPVAAVATSQPPSNRRLQCTASGRIWNMWADSVEWLAPWSDRNPSCARGPNPILSQFSQNWVWLLTSEWIVQSPSIVYRRKSWKLGVYSYNWTHGAEESRGIASMECRMSNEYSSSKNEEKLWIG